MKIKIIHESSNEFQFSLEGKSSKIIVELGRHNKFILDAFEKEILLRLTKNYPILNSYIPIVVDQSIEGYGDALVALYASCFRTELLSGFETLSYHVVFAHAFPLALVPSILLKIADHLSEVVDNNQLLLLDSHKLILAETTGSNISVSDVVQKHDRLIKINKDLRIVYHTNIKSILLEWSIFCVSRFGEKPSEALLELFSKIYTEPSFIVKEFWLNQECIAYSLIYKDNQYGIFYDLLAPWKLECKSRRLGIFSGVHNLMEAHNLRLKYCMCYGDFPYKHEVLSGCPISKIPEIHYRDNMRNASACPFL